MCYPIIVENNKHRTKGDTMIKGYFVDRDGQIYYYESGKWIKVERRPL